MSFEIVETDIPDLLLVFPKLNNDSRGCFAETYKHSSFKDSFLEVKFVQDNVSISKKNVLRGLHFQNPPYAQGKLVTVLKGQIFDVVVDLRPESSTYGNISCNVLKADNFSSLYVPEGFAHGFLSLEDNTIIHYKTTKEYSPGNESGIKWNDKSIDINWPLNHPIVSEKDQSLPSFKNISK